MAFRPWRRLGCFSGLVFGVVLVLLVTAVLAPWAYHIGGRWTPAMWRGFGMLRTESGDAYPLFIYFYPNFRSMSRLRLNGQRPSSGLRGMGWLCSAQGVTQRLDLSGDIYGTYLNTDGNQMGIRLLDARHYFQINPQRRRYFDLYGRWHGPELVMGDDGGWERGFHPDPHNPKVRAKVTFTWGALRTSKNCATPPRYRKRRESRRRREESVYNPIHVLRSEMSRHSCVRQPARNRSSSVCDSFQFAA